MSDPVRPFRPGRLAVVGAMTVMAGWLFLRGLGETPLASWDEAGYAELAREMVQTGDWLTPHWNGGLWFEKPPVGLWFTAVTFRVLGVNEFTARLWSALAGVAVVAGVTAFGQALFGGLAGFYAGAYLLGWSQFIDRARTGTLDTLLLAWHVATLACFWRGRERPGWFITAGITGGLAVLTKGPAGIVPFLVIIGFIVVTGDRDLLWRPALWIGGGLALVIAASWHLVEIARYGSVFITQYFGLHLVTILLDPTQSQPPLSLYFRVLATDMKYQGLLLAVVALDGLFHFPPARLSWRGWSGPLPPKWAYILLWMVVPALVVAVTRSRIRWYIVPAYPALALMLGVASARATRLVVSERHWRRAALGVALIIGLVGVPLDALKSLRAVRRSQEKYSSAATVARIMQAQSRGTDRVVTTVDLLPAVVFYGGLRTIAIRGWPDLRDALGTPGRTFFILREREAAPLRRLASTRDLVEGDDVRLLLRPD